MFQEYQIVKLKKGIKDIPFGSMGTILIVHDGLPPAYIVEFINDEGKTIGVETITEENLELIDAKEY